MKYQIILQHNEEDCGAACLATIAQHHGKRFSINHIRSAIGTGQLGTTLLGLTQGAEELGFNARAVRASSEVLNWLDELPLPTILHWQGNHYVVLYGTRSNALKLPFLKSAFLKLADPKLTDPQSASSKYVIADPSVGMRCLSQQELLEGWTNGVMLILEPDPVRFLAQSDDPISSFGRFFQSVWSYRSLLTEAFVINIVLGLLSLSIPFLIQILTDDVLVRGDRSLLGGIILAVVCMELISNGLQLIQSNLIAHFAQRLELNLVLEFGRKILKLPLSYYESHRSGEIVSRLRDIEEVNQLISQVVISFPSRLIVAIVSLALMLVYSRSLVIAAVLVAGIMTVSTIVLLSTLQQRIRKFLVLEAENQGVLVETFKGALTVKTTMAAPQLWQEFQSRFGHLANVAFQTIQISILNRTFSMAISGTGSIAILWLGSELVIQKELSIGQLLAFNTLNENFLAFALLTIRFVNEFIRANAAVQRLAEVIDCPPEALAHKPWVTLLPQSDIHCSQVSYHYAGRLELFEDLTLKIPGGCTTAIVGKSGCGKSTLAKLIASLYPVQAGNLRIGKYNVQDLSLDCLRQQVVLIPQEAHFWSRSILENFRLGAPSLSFEQIVNACEIADADEFISQLPDKYQTILGEFGANLSGGQRQRLAIARAIATDPPILILDESTGGLDPMSESRLLNRLLESRQGKTTILITHRPAVMQRADWIIVLEQGKLLLEGTAEILNRSTQRRVQQ